MTSRVPKSSGQIEWVVIMCKQPGHKGSAASTPAQSNCDFTRITLRCFFADATARSAGSWCASPAVSTWAEAVELLKGLKGLLQHALAIEDVDGLCNSLKKQAEAPAATRLLPAAQPSWGSISAAAFRIVALVRWPDPRIPRNRSETQFELVRTETKAASEGYVTQVRVGDGRFSFLEAASDHSHVAATSIWTVFKFT